MTLLDRQPLQRRFAVYSACIAAALLAVSMVAFGYRSAGQAMLIEATFRQTRAPTTHQRQTRIPEPTIQFEADDLSRAQGD